VAVLILKPPHGGLEVKRPLRSRPRSDTDTKFITVNKCPFGCSGYVTAVAVGFISVLYCQYCIWLEKKVVLYVILDLGSWYFALPGTVRKPNAG
jgi:hypothetical protein